MNKKAVALKYPDGAPAPFIVASAQGKLSEQLVKIAKDHAVPIVANDMLTDVLSLQEIGSYVPDSTWEVLAGIFAFIYNEEDKK
ncbi:MAG: EscU/YscU/HrcU family type III secretion system export apparatus switch protein [Treponema sp.]|nr:EscU/YscU/HrcU family type III secretion system export apparatus switch protein [Treponema sp.]